MTTAEQRVASLEQQLADLEVRFAQLERDAFYLKTLEEFRLERAGYSAGPRPALTASRPWHLRTVQGGQR